MTTVPLLRPRRGFALPMAIIALVLLSALVAGALFVSTEELRSGGQDVADQRVLAASEWALDRAILSWDAAQNTRDSVGRTAVLTDTTAPNARIVVRATRVQRHAVWMTAEVVALDPRSAVPARHTTGVSLRLIPPRVTGSAAFTALGAVSVNGGTVDGRSGVLAGDASGVCADDDTMSVAGIRVPTPSRVSCPTCSGSGDVGVLGSPPIDSLASAASDSSLTRLIDDMRRSLTARASVGLAGGVFATRPTNVAGECNRADAFNWGDPSSAGPCADYYPIVRVRGDASLAAGSIGQGILLVDGSLRLEANARFVGVVIVAGDIVVDGIGAEIVGVAIAEDAGGAGESRVTNGGAIRFTRCALHRAALGSARLERTPGRWWTELR